MLRSCICLFLRKRLEQFMFHIFPAHTDPTVCNPEFIQNILTVTRNLCHISIYGSIFFIVFDCVAKQIHHNSL